jgi:hypothetical protein
VIEIRTASNRRVVLTTRHALKFPRLRHPMCGLRSNLWEREMWYRWRPIFRWDTLCPVLFADRLGIVLVMPRAGPADPTAVDAAIERDGEFYPQPTTEFLPAGYGMMNGRVVCFDYGLADADMVRERRTYYAEFRTSETHRDDRK